MAPGSPGVEEDGGDDDAAARERLGQEPAQEYPKLGGFRPAQVGPVADGLVRYPSLSSSRGLLRGADYLGTVAFAMSGAITAGTVGMDAVGCTIVGTTVALGGGTMRDAIILHKQPFWVEEYEYLLMAAAAALATSMLWPTLPSDGYLKDDNEGEGKLLWAGDALGVGAFAVIGCQNALRMCLHPVIACTCGMVTATFGGLTRDVLCGLPKETQGNGRIMHSHGDLYASTAFAGAASYVFARSMALPLAVRIFSGVGISVGLRYAAATYELGLPSWDKPAFRTVEGAKASSSASVDPAFDRVDHDSSRASHSSTRQNL
ncbi:Hypothetical Protein FCC1311_033972 [Hondaea fermentalgiana]|uniref:Glycine transporter domain-containing protein n=1 Tax=Hondaea fermentalgiana TaxID=2315210 RepID=A0A2R5GH45_9STRA|nr:Hypothetical Protein FCC1311_033972 [Hondaea fermentalgiana]|eukprot:GBG27174.1 Hypothetical Protein FCC1311_033972 [Hondaea fermentalgiana]